MKTRTKKDYGITPEFWSDLLPEGWKVEKSTSVSSVWWVEVSGEGAVTIDFETRAFELGWMAWVKRGEKKQSGQGWRQWLANAAIAKLKEVIAREKQLVTPEIFSRPGIYGVYAGNYDASKFTDTIKLTPKGGDTPCLCSPNAAVSNAPELVQSLSDAQEAITRIANHLGFNGTAIELAEMIEGFQVKHVNLKS